MAGRQNLKISQLTDGSALQDADVIPVVRDGANVKVTPTNLLRTSNIGTTVKGYADHTDAEVTVDGTGATYDVSPANGKNFALILDDDTNFTFTYDPEDNRNAVMFLEIIQDNSGGHTPSFTGVTFPAGAPVVDETADASTFITVIITNRGVTGFAEPVNEISDYRKMLTIKDIVLATTGTFTITRVAQGDYVLRKTAADDTSVIGIEITEELRTATNKGFKLASFDVIFRNTTADLDAHSVTLDTLTYTDSEAVSVSSVAITGTLGVGQDADPQIDNVVVDTPAYLITGDKQVLEITVDAATTSVYDFIGVRLNFARADN